MISLNFGILLCMIWMQLIQADMPPAPANLRVVPPCAKGQTKDCDPNRFFKCGTIPASQYSQKFTKHTLCQFGGRIEPYNKEKVLVQFNGSEGCTEIVMTVGECWGPHPFTDGNYDCQGRCGAACSNGDRCSNWAADCLRHDACSWYYGSQGGHADKNCGDEWNTAVLDTISPCGLPGKSLCESKYNSFAASTKEWVCGS